MIAEDLPTPIEIAGGDILVDAALVGELLDIIPADVPALMRAHAITSLCERGVDVHEGEFRLNFFYRNRHARLSVDMTGQPLQFSVIDSGKRVVTRKLRKLEDCHSRKELGDGTYDRTTTDPNQSMAGS